MSEISKKNDTAVLQKTPKKRNVKDSKKEEGDIAIVKATLKAFDEGDFSARLPEKVAGLDDGSIKLLNSIFTRAEDHFLKIEDLHNAICKEGKSGEQLAFVGKGHWRERDKYINEILQVGQEYYEYTNGAITAIKKGQLAVGVDNGDYSVDKLRGDYLRSVKNIDSTVAFLEKFLLEMTNLLTEVGIQGKLGGQLTVKDALGVWKDLRDTANNMVTNLTLQLRDVYKVSSGVAKGDLTQKITVECTGEIQTIKEAINTKMDNLQRITKEIANIAIEVGENGRLGIKADVSGVTGVWRTQLDDLNNLVANLTLQLRDVYKVATGVVRGDLTQKITVECKGEIQIIKEAINAKMDNLQRITQEISRIAQDVGKNGKLGIAADVQGVSGIWRTQLEDLNNLVANISLQFQDVAKVAAAIEKGDLTQKMTVDCKGEILSIKNTINDMMIQLAGFVAEVIGVTKEVGVEGKLGGQVAVEGISGVWKELASNVNTMAGSLTTQVREITAVATAVAQGDLSKSINTNVNGEFNVLKDNINEMIANLYHTTKNNEKQNWLKSNLNKIAIMLQGQRDLSVVAKSILNELAVMVSAQHGVFYLCEETKEEPVLKLFATFAYKKRKELSNVFKFGEGLVGECALEKQRIVITDVPSDYIAINSGLGHGKPYNIVVLPIVFEGKIKGVIELASFREFSEIMLNLLDQLTDNLGIAITSIESSYRTEQLLQQSQSLTEELQVQQEELRQTNEELEEKARQLSEQNTEVRAKRSEIELAKKTLEEKAEQLALSSKYKSEFLANMSHELRTPLNSLLILSKQLSENTENNLTAKQVNYAGTIHSAGVSLLTLINEILDLAKVESGKMPVNIGDVEIKNIVANCEREFAPLAEEKKLEFLIAVDDDVAKFMQTDGDRVQQIVRNLLSNAFKFTEKGMVKLSVKREKINSFNHDNERLNRAQSVISFNVTDTGIGVAKNKHNLIFEAFQQADGSTSRKYGGTGLGLSISREIAKMLGGEIKMTSEVGKGSSFILYLPEVFNSEKTKMTAAEGEVQLSVQQGKADAVYVQSELNKLHIEQEKVIIADDRTSIEAGDRLFLIIEDDVKFASILADVAHEHDFKAIIAVTGAEGIELAEQYQPDGITLDINLPDIEGTIVLDRLKHNQSTRHIPVHIISAFDKSTDSCRMGAISYLQKPAQKEDIDDVFIKAAKFLDRKIKELLIVEDNEIQRKSIIELIGNSDVKTTAVATGKEALECLAAKSFDCVVMDLGLPDISGFELIEKIKSTPDMLRLPIIIYTGRELSQKEEIELRKLAGPVIIKDVSSPERLFDETALFLHRIEAKLPENKRKIITGLRQKDPLLKGKKVLVVDDDVRNIFALTSYLEQHGMRVVYAENGREGLESLEQNTDVDIVLMDIMMPEMDGYDAMKIIRKHEKFKKIPLIALTAKAMKGDREKCIACGASDYLSKPVDTKQLLSLLRVWLYR